jgi:hypothetical protein
VQPMPSNVPNNIERHYTNICHHRNVMKNDLASRTTT